MYGKLFLSTFAGKQNVMKSQILFSLATLLSLSLTSSCTKESGQGGQGQIVIQFSEHDYTLTKASASDIPDTSEFILEVTDSKGKSIYSGKYGDSPASILVNAGTYNVSVRSGEFKAPKFSAPLFGDDQCVVVPSGGVEVVSLTCAQVNSGIKLKIASNFLTSYPDGVLYVKSDDGRLLYGYSEKRIAYFNPGNVSVVMDNAGSQSTLFTRALKGREVLSVGISAPNPPSSSTKKGAIKIEVDTTRTWLTEHYTIGSGSGSGGNSGSGNSMSNAYDITTAKKHIGESKVWVYGYIVGAFKSSTSLVTSAPFDVYTNLAISGRTSVSGKDACLSVELKKSDIREDLNLMDHPSYLGKKVYLRGDIVEAYFGIPGLKNVTEYEMD